MVKYGVSEKLKNYFSFEAKYHRKSTMLKLLVLSLAMAYVTANHPIADCGGTEATFQNLAVAFFDKNGQSSNSVNFPGSIKLVSGTIQFHDTSRTLTGCELVITVEDSIFHICHILEDLGIHFCERNFCDLLTDVQKENVCAKIAKGASVDITTFPVQTFNLPAISSWPLRIALNGANVAIGAKVMCSGKTNACINTHVGVAID